MNRYSQAKDSATQIIEVRRGLYALRYVSASPENASPRISVESSSDAEIEIIGMPGAKYATLSKPSELLVIRAFGPAQIRIQVTALHEGGSIVADVRLEDLQSIGTVRPESNAHLTGDLLEITTPQIEIIGHLSRVGDVLVKSNEWIAGKLKPSNIEGIKIVWLDKPVGIDLLVEGVLGGRAHGKPAPICVDGLVGSRGRAIPLNGLKLLLSGVNATRYNLRVESLFRGCEVNESRGRSITVSGPTGSEALIGLKIGIELATENRKSDTEKPSDRTQNSPLVGSTNTPARVRVFKRST